MAPNSSGPERVLFFRPPDTHEPFQIRNTGKILVCVAVTEYLKIGSDFFQKLLARCHRLALNLGSSCFSLLSVGTPLCLAELRQFIEGRTIYSWLERSRPRSTSGRVYTSLIHPGDAALVTIYNIRVGVHSDCNAYPRRQSVRWLNRFCLLLFKVTPSESEPGDLLLEKQW